MRGSVLVDKTMLIADVIDSGYTATLFCRPRRFGKTFNMTMMKAFFEKPSPCDQDALDANELFEGTQIWDAKGGAYRRYAGAYPVVYLSFNTVKKLTWEASFGELRNLIAVEFARHAELADSQALNSQDKQTYRRISDATASDADFYGALATLCRLLRIHHGTNVVLLVDEYDAPSWRVTPTVTTAR